MKNTAVTVGDVRYEFGADGFVENAFVLGFNGVEYRVNNGDFGRIRMKLSDGRTLVPYSAGSVILDKTERASIVEFPEILWRDEDGAEVPNFRLALRYELMSSGRAFVNAFFCANDMHSPDLDQFDLKFDLASGDFANTRWGLVPRPKKFDGSMIQAMRSGRGLLPGDNRLIDHEIVPCFNMNLRAGNGETAYFEIMVEGENYISCDKGDCATDLHWSDSGDLNATYSFIRNKPCKNKLMQLWQWRNQWGWVLKTADKSRRKPPMHMHHYFDNFVRYPSNEALENIARWGTDVLILHENWRNDIQNDGTPWKHAELLRTVEKAHSLGMRIALYIRGSEIGAVDGACEWFDRYLKKDYDGLYMDYGGPFHQSQPDEAFPGGRIPFKEYLLRMQSLRDRIGEDGIFYGHTGTSYSGIWYAGGGIDGYVSGEGEGGVMVSSRENHEYFSMATVSPGTMWTGAFPAYSTGKMRPFLAVTGQYPHSPLGEQFKTSSLAHPREPGVNDVAFRPVWKIWKPFKNERNMTVLNEYNSSGVFRTESKDAGFYMMVSQDKKRALLCVANFSENTNDFRCKPAPALCGFDPAGMNAWKLAPTEKTPGKAVAVDAAALDFEFSLGKWDVAAILFESDEAEGLKHVAEFETPYPEHSAENLRYLAYLAEQTAARNVGQCKTCTMRLSVPNTNLSYEYSLIYDLYYNAMALVEFMPDGSRKRLGWISQKGFTADEPAPEDYIWPDVTSPAIDLHKILGKGEHHIGIESVHYGAPFYSFLSVEITPDDEAPRTLYFMNELEPDREYLRWRLTLV